MFKKLLIGAGLLIAITVVASQRDGGDDAPGPPGPRTGERAVAEVVQVPVPGESTLSFNGRIVTTRVTGVSIRHEALPGNQSTPLTTRKAHLAFKVEVENRGRSEHELSYSVYRLKMPTGEVVEYLGGSGSPADEDFTGVTLPPGTKKVGQVTWEVSAPKPGETYVLIWKPSRSETEVHFTYQI